MQRARRLEHADVEHHAEQRPEHCAESADQAISEAVHAEHDVEVARLDVGVVMREQRAAQRGERPTGRHHAELQAIDVDSRRAGELRVMAERAEGDRKSTRLNSSHRTISYAVFCLKKKRTTY